MKKIDENACFVIRCVNGEERILIPAVYANNGHRACIVVAHLTPLSLLTHPTRRPSSSSTIQQQVLLVSRPSRIPLPPPMRASFDRHRHAFILNHPPPPSQQHSPYCKRAKAALRDLGAKCDIVELVSHICCTTRICICIHPTTTTTLALRP